VIDMKEKLAVAVLALAFVRPALAVEVGARMDEIVQSYVAAHQFMGSVLVVRDGETLLDRGYGSADLEWEVPNTLTTKFRLGSITKQFTAACFLLLEEQGKLKLDDPVKTHLPDAPAAWDKITIFHLLTHTSGIPNLTEFPDFRHTMASPATPRELLARFRDKPLDFAPGEKHRYSNSGYLLLGHLLETISEQPYADFVTQQIFQPLGMKDSGYDSAAAILPRRAAGYRRGSDPKAGFTHAKYIHMSVPFAAGGLYSTTHDLLLWERGLFGGRLLKPASLKKMTTAYKGDYALGIGVMRRNGRPTIEHGGGIDGFASHLIYRPQDELVVAVLANVEGPAAHDIAVKLEAVAHGETVVLPTERTEISVPASVLTPYVGTYRLATKELTVSLEGGQLMAQLTGQPKLALFAESETAFFLKVVDAQLEFVKDTSGVVSHVVLRQGGRDTKAPRIP
jgi:CubicO group peptidase (beta-lactamase class C family)